MVSKKISLVILLASFMVILIIRVSATNSFINIDVGDTDDSSAYSGRSVMLQQEKAINCTTTINPEDDLQTALNNLQAESILCLNEGTYAGNFNIIDKRGDEQAWITITSTPGQTAVIQSTDHASSGIRMIRSSYISISNLVIQADPNVNDGGAAIATGTGGSDENAGAHHIQIKNNILEGFGYGGFSGAFSDFVELEGNVIRNGAALGIYQGSGVSFLYGREYGSSPENTYANVVKNNIIYNNEVLVTLPNGRVTDGNCIIFDLNNAGKYYPGSPNYKPNDYTHRTLVENNLCIGNGASGLHAFASDHIDFIQNTVYMNGKDSLNKLGSTGELSCADCDDVLFSKNLVWTRPNATDNPIHIISYSGRTLKPSISNNLFVGRTPDQSYLSNNVFSQTNPGLAMPTEQSNTWNFTVTPDSLARSIEVGADTSLLPDL